MGSLNKFVFFKNCNSKKVLDVPKNVARSIEPKIAFELSFKINANETNE